jgi:hypothetical protein
MLNPKVTRTTPGAPLVYALAACVSQGKTNVPNAVIVFVIKKE